MSEKNSFKFLSAFFIFFTSDSIFLAFSFANFYSFKDFPFPGDPDAVNTLLGDIEMTVEDPIASIGALIKWSGNYFGSYRLASNFELVPASFKLGVGSGLRTFFFLGEGWMTAKGQ